MCDVNKRALHLTELNIKENKIYNASVILSDCYTNIDKETKYDYIITNPPIHAGKDKVYEIVIGAKNHLSIDGTLFIVIRKDQGAKSMIKELEKYYNNKFIANRIMKKIKKLKQQKQCLKKQLNMKEQQRKY